ncbi:MAG: methionyl-tRNA formyltransferase [Cellvibrionaceae bacterium]|jgi:methionyl-tRNA formyltransferase
MMPSSSGLRLIFAGTPLFAAYYLKALIDSDHQVVAVYTQPDRPSGRGKKQTHSAVKTLALQSELPVYQPPTLKHIAIQRELSQHRADVMVVVAYGLILPKATLDVPRLGCLNVHASLLPRWRGAAPIQRAIETGDRQTGISIMQMDVGLDTGPVLCKREYTLSERETAGSLQDKLQQLGTPVLLETLRNLQCDDFEVFEQDDALATYAEKIHKQEALIDWSQSAENIDRKIRAFNPSPVAYTYLNGDRIKIHQASPATLNGKYSPGEFIEIDNKALTVACGLETTGALSVLKITRLQLPGKKIMTMSEILNGFGKRFSSGQHFSSSTEV